MTTIRENQDDDARWVLLGRFLAGECNADEAAFVEHWLDENPARRRVVTALDSTLRRLASDTSAVDAEAALQLVRSRMQAADLRPIDGRERPARAWRTTLLRMAAAVVLLLAGALVWRAGDLRQAPAALSVWTTEAGETETITLPDGSSVLLAPLSRLSMGPDYGAGRRSLELDGQAMFDVMHRRGQPFIVQAGAALVEDIGTAFTVRHVGDQPVQVVVTEGAVRLRPIDARQEQGIILRQGDIGLLDRSGQVVARPASATEDDVAWTRGRLAFVDAPLSHVTGELRRWHGIDVQVADSALADRHVTVTFEEETIDQILDVLGLVLGARVERRGNTVMLHAQDEESVAR